MNFLDILYLVTSLTSLVASVPQVRQLLKEKRSEELSLSTWTMWFICQITFLSYVYSRGEVLMLATNSIWLVFYGTMLFLIVYYRRNSTRIGSDSEPVIIDEA